MNHINSRKRYSELSDLKFLVKDPDDSDTVRKEEGFTNIRIEVSHNGEDVAYMIISHLPDEWIWEHIPTAYHYKYAIDNDFKDFLDPDAIRLVDILKELFRKGTVDVLQLHTPRKALSRYLGKYGDKYREFISFNRNKPKVELVYVEENWRRHGVAPVLYEYAGRLMGSKGYGLWQGAIQTNGAQRVWRKMELDHRVPLEYNVDEILPYTGKPRMYLDYTRTGNVT